ncbi:MAG: hypothetical protein AABW79_04560 [Nanoarchaeota archaeon]
MKKGVFLFTLVLLISISQVFAADNQTSPSADISDDSIDKAYQCLESELGNKTSSSLSLSEAIFSTLALGESQKTRDKIEDERSNKNCWPKSSCKLKETAQVLLAYDHIGKNTNDIKKYLYERNGSTSDLSWFVMIDISNHISSTCTIKQGSTTRTINIGEDQKISGDAGSCLSVIPSGFWLQISSSCLEQKFEISCNQDFISTLVYQKSGIETIFISPDTHSASSSGTTIEQVNAKCFKLSSSCDYEGTLWAALALQQAGDDISAYIPYLLALAPENQNLLPSSFIFKLTNADDHYSTLVQAQKQSKFWEAPTTPYNKFYDTSLALLALQGRQSTESDNAKSYLQSIQTPKGCWNNNNIRDTAFVLYSAFPDSSRSGSIGGGGSIEQCQTAGFSCSPLLECLDGGGEILGNYVCSGSLKCCSLESSRKSCSQLLGQVCTSNERCSSTELPSSDGSCCTGVCEPSTTSEDQCTSSGGFCQSSCDLEFEDESSDQCSLSSEVCCFAKDTESSSGSSYGWIILLLLLIVLVVLAIVYRKKLQLWYFKFRNRGGLKSSQVITRRPPFPPMLPSQTRPYAPVSSQPQRRAPSRLDKEMEETLKKLREIGK